MKSEVAKRLRQLEYENRRLKQLLVDLSLKNRMLKYVTSKEYLVRLLHFYGGIRTGLGERREPR